MKSLKLGHWANDLKSLISYLDYSWLVKNMAKVKKDKKVERPVQVVQKREDNACGCGHCTCG